MEIRNLT